MLTARNDAVTDAGSKQSAVDQAFSRLSLVKLDQAALVFRVAFDKSLDAWQGPVDDAVPGCRISGRDAESGIAAVNPWLDLRAGEEAKKALAAPKSYKFPVDVETCERDCTCGLGVKILNAANLDGQNKPRAKELKKLRTRFEAKSELMTHDRAELCAEGATWICTSEVLKALQPPRVAD